MKKKEVKDAAIIILMGIFILPLAAVVALHTAGIEDEFQEAP